MISVVIRNKNEEKELEFLLRNLFTRYRADIEEVIVIDNLSVDGSREISEKYGARFVTIEKFSYGGSANLAAQEARCDIVVMFSAHAFPVSHDFFKLIRQRFDGNEERLAGLRCIHNVNDYKAFINNVSSRADHNIAGLNFAASAFNRKVWEKHNFKADIRTFEDKEWTKRVVKNGYDIEFVPAVFCYHTVRTKKQQFFRFKNEVIGGYQLHHTEYSFAKATKGFLFSLSRLARNFIVDLIYLIKRYWFLLRFISNKPEKFQ